MGSAILLGILRVLSRETEGRTGQKIFEATLDVFEFCSPNCDSKRPTDLERV
jgi:hypothetical protein